MQQIVFHKISNESQSRLIIGKKYDVIEGADRRTLPLQNAGFIVVGETSAKIIDDNGVVIWVSTGFRKLDEMREEKLNSLLN